MTATVVDETVGTTAQAPPPPPTEPRPHAPLVGAALGVAAAAMLVAGLLAAFVAARAQLGPHFRPKGYHLPLSAVNVALLTGVISSFTVQWAVSAIRHGDRRNTYLALGVTMALGFAWVNAIAFSWSQMRIGVRKSEYAVVYFTLTGTHLVVLLVAMVGLAVVAFRTLGSDDAAGARDAVAAGAMVWQFAVASAAVIHLVVYGAPFGLEYLLRGLYR
jgi:heme/copper-type cytochrome/quinol oxidase subunit 3